MREREKQNEKWEGHLFAKDSLERGMEQREVKKLRKCFAWNKNVRVEEREREDD